MPNWCENRLVVSGNEDTVRAFVNGCKAVYGGEEWDFSFMGLVPLPNGVWDYDNANRFWGTKWDASVQQVYDNGSTFEIYFDTAWGPPVSWLESVVALFPSLSFEMWCCEGGCDFSAHFEGMDGDFNEDFSDSFMTWCEYLGYVICAECGGVSGWCDCDEMPKSPVLEEVAVVLEKNIKEGMLV